LAAEPSQLRMTIRRLPSGAQRSLCSQKTGAPAEQPESSTCRRLTPHAHKRRKSILPPIALCSSDDRQRLAPRFTKRISARPTGGACRRLLRGAGRGAPPARAHAHWPVARTAQRGLDGHNRARIAISPFLRLQARLSSGTVSRYGGMHRHRGNEMPVDLELGSNQVLVRGCSAVTSTARTSTCARPSSEGAHRRPPRLELAHRVGGSTCP